ncbi:MAG: DNA-3-methyladenine glycosylase [Anaerolineales bacterium]|nr:DNA-3-methyladenine glycosylase [Anaerolineales bacterium]
MRISRNRSARLPRAFFRQPTLQTARALLGTRLVRLDRGRRLSGIIVETEAYIGRQDLGCHASRGGRTPRNEAMFGLPGRAYVYFTYGMHWLLNVVTEDEGIPAAVLVRAMIPDEGREAMRRRRAGREPLAGGPAMLCMALGIDKRWNGHDLCKRSSRLYLERAFSISNDSVTKGPRVGLYTVPEPWKSIPWRFRASPAAVEILSRQLAESPSGAGRAHGRRSE